MKATESTESTDVFTTQSAEGAEPHPIVSVNSVNSVVIILRSLLPTPFPLRIAKRRHRIDFGRPARGHVTSHDSDQDQKQCDDPKHRNVVLLHAEQQRLQEA